MKRSISTLTFLFMVTATAAHGATPGGPENLPTASKQPHSQPMSPALNSRAVRIGLSTPVLLDSPFSDASRTGLGINGVYEFLLSPRFTIGIDLAYRAYPGSQSLHQLGYGLLLKHYVATCACEERDIRPFVEYGLLLNVSRRAGVSGSGTAHDTRLTLGADFAIADIPLYATLSYHYSRLQYFGTNALNLDSIEPEIGWRYQW